MSHVKRLPFFPNLNRHAQNNKAEKDLHRGTRMNIDYALKCYFRRIIKIDFGRAL